MTVKLDSESFWDQIYRSNNDRGLSWYEGSESISFNWIVDIIPKTSRVADIGGGRSLLVPKLLSVGYKNLSHIEWSESASLSLQRDLGSRASEIDWVTGDLTRWQPKSLVDLWHDRAVLHFQTDKRSCSEYLKSLHRNLSKTGYALLAAFHLDGPDSCSGLPVKRYDDLTLLSMLQSFDGSNWTKVQSVIWTHKTPTLKDQKFQYLLAKRESS